MSCQFFKSYLPIIGGEKQPLVIHYATLPPFPLYKGFMVYTTSMLRRDIRPPQHFRSLRYGSRSPGVIRSAPGSGAVRKGSGATFLFVLGVCFPPPNGLDSHTVHEVTEVYRDLCNLLETHGSERSTGTKVNHIA